MADRFIPKAVELTPTQKAFADRILNDITELFRDDQTVLDIIRGRVPRTRVFECFRDNLYAGVANYYAVRTGQLKYVQDELRRVLELMPGLYKGVPLDLTGRMDGIDYPADNDSSWNNAIPRSGVIPGPRPGNFDTSLGHGCDECGNTHGDAHSSTCKRGKA